MDIWTAACFGFWTVIGAAILLTLVSGQISAVVVALPVGLVIVGVGAAASYLANGRI